jgi:hypothetical protein
MSAMKDWKTYAIIVLAAWCAYLTWRSPSHGRATGQPTNLPRQVRASSLGHSGK